MTYADKYALMKAYKLAGGTAEDPDSEASPEEGGSPPLSMSPQSSQQLSQEKQNVWSPLGINSVIPQQARPSQTRSAEGQSDPRDASPATEPTQAPNCKANGQQSSHEGRMSISRARSYVLPFGPEKGKTLGEVLHKNRKIVEFFASDEFQNDEYQELKEVACCLLNGSV